MADLTRFVLPLLSLLFVSVSASAAVRVDRTWDSDVANAEFYRLSSTSKQLTDEQAISAIGKKIRQGEYRKGLRIDGFITVESDLETSIIDLRESTQEFRALNDRDVDLIRGFAAKNNARTYLIDLVTNYHGGTGMERIYVYLSQSKNLALVVRKFWYAE